MTDIRTPIDLVPVPPEVLADLDNLLWCSTANSFEDRSTAALECLCSHGRKPGAALLLEYPSTTETIQAEKDRQAKGAVNITDLLPPERTQRKHIRPYSFSELVDTLSEASSLSSYRRIVIDLTCITKIHAIAAASWLSQREDLLDKVTVIYTRAENYVTGNEGQRRRGWKDIIVSPFSSKAILKNERYGRGVVILGHEADRLIVALGEIEPTSGAFVVPYTEHRPDLRERCELVNKRPIGRLIRGAIGSWKKVTVEVSDVFGLIRVVEEQVNAAMKYRAPIILFPFGPKLQLFVAAYKISSMAPLAAWFVYPVPMINDISQTEGVDQTLWLKLGTLV